MASASRQTGVSSRRYRSLAVLLTLLAVSIAVSVLIFVHLNTVRQHDERYFSLTNEQEILAERVSQFAQEAMRGSPTRLVGSGPFLELKDARLWFQDILDTFENGNEVGLPPAPAGASEEIGQVREVWQETDERIATVVELEGVMPDVRQAADELAILLPAYIEQLERRANLDAVGAVRQQALMEQALRVQRILSDIEALTSGGQGMRQASGRLQAEVDAFVSGLRQLAQSPQAVAGGPRIAPWERLLQDLDLIRELGTTIADNAPTIVAGHEAANNIRAEPLLDALAVQERAFRDVIAARPIEPLHGAIAGALALILLVASLSVLASQIRNLLNTAREQNRRNQEAIMRLLDEMGTLAEGDLTVQATVTEDITGAIADSINYAIEALRDLVTTINNTAERVATAAEESEQTATRLIEASEHQTQQINAASEAIDNMARSIGQVSENAQRSAKVAQQSVQIAAKGGTAVRRTIEGMDSIREQIQETSKRIKRLGESSQEIGNIVELINDIAEQTNILALNAAIQASSAGEQGRGFAVVADEVQRLAERSTNATKQIEALVRTIQADTNEAVTSMENSTSGVVQGAKLAEDAGNSLDEIERVSNQIASLVQSISDAATQQTEQASEVANNMSQIQEITVQTAEGTRATGESIGRLAELATELRESVSGFKLP